MGGGKIKSKLVWCMKAPIRGLCRARDLYVKSMMGCSGRHVSTMPRRNHFPNSRGGQSDDDFKELMNAVLQAKKVEVVVDDRTKGHNAKIGTIDEDKEMEFEPGYDTRTTNCVVSTKNRVSDAK